MQFITVRDFRIRPGEVWKQLEKDDLVVTSNGRPIAILTNVDAENLEDMLITLRRVRAQMAVSRLRQAAAESGVSQLTAAEIEEEISLARADR
jgi:prevent-host-death family protein